MVIHQFNKLIRNKWVWGVFAILVSAAFCFEDLFSTRDREERAKGVAGTLAGASVGASEFDAIAEDVRGLGKNRDWKRASSEVNRVAWETIAALRVARENGIEATPAEIQQVIRADRAFQENGAFSFRAYQYLLREVGMTPERFEEYLKRRLTVKRVTEDVLESAMWVSPMELGRAVADMTDVFTVKVAKFTQTKAEADAVSLDDAGLRKWYDANTNSIALPERMKVRYVRYSSSDPKVLAKMTVSDDEMHDYYDANSEKWTTTGTNGVEQVKKFDEVKGEIESELRKIAAIQYYETNLTSRAYGVKVAGGGSRLDEIASEDGAKVALSDYFTVEGGYVEGFMKRPETLFPGADGFVDAVAQLDPASEDLRYGVVLGDKAVWLIERAEVSPAHVPTFDEAKSVIRPRALEAAKADAFKDKVDAIAKQGFAEVEKTPGISTNLTFSVSEMTPGMFTDQYAVAGAVRRLAKGEVSEFTRTGRDSAVLVLCVDRKAGDQTKAKLLESQVRDQLSMFQRRTLPEGWLKWNLERLGFEPEASASVTPDANSDEY